MYIDPNADPPGTQVTTPSAVAPGAVGSSLADLLEAAETGRLRVDRATGEATVRAIEQAEEAMGPIRRAVAASATTGTRLGGGYAEHIDRFIRDWSVGETGSAARVIDQFTVELGKLKDAVRKSMETYERSDAVGAYGIERVDRRG